MQDFEAVIPHLHIVLNCRVWFRRFVNSSVYSTKYSGNSSYITSIDTSRRSRIKWDLGYNYELLLSVLYCSQVTYADFWPAFLLVACLLTSAYISCSLEMALEYKIRLYKLRPWGKGERTIPRLTKHLACSCSHEKYGSTLLDVHVRRLATSLELSEPEPTSFFFRLLSSHFFSIFVTQGLCGMRGPARLYPNVHGSNKSLDLEPQIFHVTSGSLPGYPLCLMSLSRRRNFSMFS